MKNNGWVKTHRKLLESSIANQPEFLALWITLLLMANHKKTSFLLNMKKISLEAGQVLTTRSKLAQQTGIEENKIYRLLKCLEIEHQIEQQKTNKYTIITILKWNEYQGNEQEIEQQMNNKRTTNEQQMNNNSILYKNVKNDKNVEEVFSKENSPSDERAVAVGYGSADVNEIMKTLKQAIGGTLDGTEKSNRQYAYNLLRKLKKDYPDGVPVKMVILLIHTAMSDDFHSKNATSFKYLYYNAQKIIATRKQKSSGIISIN